jgi:hypothetical protein
VPAPSRLFVPRATRVTRVTRVTRAIGAIGAACAILTATPVATLAAQDPGPKPRLELADTARRAAAAANAPVANRPAPAVAVGSAPALATPADPRANVSGVRMDFVRNQSALGVMLYGPAFATTMSRDGLAWAASYLLMAGGSFVASAEVSRQLTITDPMQRLATAAPIRGAVAGSILAALLDADAPATAGAIYFASLGGTAAGLWKGREMNDGEAAATIFGSDVLGLAAYGAATGAGFENDGKANRTRLAASLAGMLVGAPLGHAYAALAPYHVSAGDVTAMTATAGVGMLAGLTAVANGPRTDRAIATALTVGGLAGLVAGDFTLVRRYDHSPSQGRLMVAGGLAGGLMGAGVALLTGGSQARWSAYSAAFTTVGAAGGIALSQRYLGPRADGAMRIGGISLEPMGVVAAATGLRGSYTLGSIRF